MVMRLIIGLLIAATLAIVMINGWPGIEGPSELEREDIIDLADLRLPAEPKPPPPSWPTPRPAPEEIRPSENRITQNKETEVIPPAAPAPPPPALKDQEFYSRTAGAVIQILCQNPSELFAASGTVVNERGLVITNAHVAEIIEKSGEPNCQARSGSPADSFAKIEVVFIASTTAKIGETQVPQRDFAFLRLLEPRGPISAVEIDPNYLGGAGEWFFTLGYPSEFLQALATSVNSNRVFSKLAVAGITDIDGNLQTPDGYIFRGGLILQQGSSGTALFSAWSGKVVGLVFATTKGQTTEDREGVALATPYIDRILRLETGQGLEEFVASH